MEVGLDPAGVGLVRIRFQGESRGREEGEREEERRRFWTDHLLLFLFFYSSLGISLWSGFVASGLFELQDRLCKFSLPSFVLAALCQF